MEKPEIKEVDKMLRRVLITGARGKIGTVLAPALGEDFNLYQLDMQNIEDTDTQIKADIVNYEEFIKALKKFQPINYIVHLAANPNEGSSWEDTLSADDKPVHSYEKLWLSHRNLVIDGYSPKS